MLASLFQGLETCARQGLCIRVCAAKDDAQCPFLNSFNLLCYLCMLGAHITMPYGADILNYEALSVRCVNRIFLRGFHAWGVNPRPTKLFFVTRLTKGGGLLQPPPLIFQTEPPMKLILVSLGRYGPSLRIHTKMSTIGQGVT